MVPQAPQLLMSLVVSVQVPGGPPHAVWPVGQQTPLEQEGVAPVQAVAQVPQLLGSVWRFVQVVLHSLGVLPEHPQTPEVQTPPAIVVLQDVPSGFGGLEQFPELGSHVPAEWQVSAGGGQTTAVVATQAPF